MKLFRTYGTLISGKSQYTGLKPCAMLLRTFGAEILYVNLTPQFTIYNLLLTTYYNLQPTLIFIQIARFHFQETIHRKITA